MTYKAYFIGTLKNQNFLVKKTYFQKSKLNRMKTLKFYLSIILAVSAWNLLSAQSSDVVYKNAMERMLSVVDTAKTSTEMVQAGNGFERIAMQYPKQWQPAYYTAYSFIQSVLYSPKDVAAEKRLIKAKEWLDKGDGYKDADKSEWATLRGNYFMAFIAMNPDVNGKQFYSQVMNEYKKAIALSSENPRPRLMLAVFEQNLPDFLRSKGDFCETMKAIGLLLDAETESIEKPYWGKAFYKMVSAKCLMQNGVKSDKNN